MLQLFCLLWCKFFFQTICVKSWRHFFFLQPNGDKDVLNIYQLPKGQSDGGTLLWTLDNSFSKDDPHWIEGKIEILAQNGANYKVIEM